MRVSHPVCRAARNSICARRAVPGRWTAVKLVPSKAVEALPMKLRIGNRAAFLVHTRLAECRVSLERPVVVFALRDVALSRPGWRDVTRVGLRAVGYQLGSGGGCGGRRRDVLALRRISAWRRAIAISAWWGPIAIGAWRWAIAISAWCAHLRVCRRQGHDCGQATGRKGQACCTLDDHDRSPPRIVVTALNTTAPGAVPARGVWQKRVKCRRYAMSTYEPDLAWFTLPHYPPSCLGNILARVLRCGCVGAVYDTPSP